MSDPVMEIALSIGRILETAGARQDEISGLRITIPYRFFEECRAEYLRINHTIPDIHAFRRDEMKIMGFLFCRGPSDDERVMLKQAEAGVV